MADNNDQLLDILSGVTPPEQIQEQPPVAEATTNNTETPAGQIPAPITEQTPPNTPPATEVPALNFDEELVKITGGTVKSSAELTALLQKATAATDLESRLKQYEDENISLKAKVETDPFASDFIKKYNQLAKDGATADQLTAFSRVNQVGDIDKLDIVESKVLALQLREGLTEDEARRYVNRTYKLDPEIYTEQEVSDANIELKMQAKSDRDFLKTHKSEVETSPAVQSERQAQVAQQKAEQHIQKMTPIANAVVSEAKDFFKGISINGKSDESAIKVDFTPTDASLASVKANVDAYVQNMGEDLPASEEGRAQIKGFAENLLIQANYKNWLIEAASQREKQVRAEYHNPTPIQRGADNPAPNSGNTAKEEFESRLLNSY